MAQTSLVGQSVGSYMILAKIGEGGMGAVYLAQHPLLGKQAAIKVILPQFSANPEHISRFHAEARAATMLRHPAFLNVFDFGQLPDGSAFLAMDLLEGRSLRERLEKLETLPLPVSLKIARQIAAGMAVAHDSGIIHRDLKPDNIFLELNSADRQTVQVKILDFGVAKLIEPLDGTPVTQSGALLGTPLFMSPEQCRGLPNLDGRTDIYAWGCLVFNMLIGHAPFPMQGIAAVIGAHAFTPPPKLRTLDPRIPASVSALVDRCLAKLPDERPATMSALVTSLDEIAAKLKLGPLTAGPAIGDVGLALGTDGRLPAASGSSKAMSSLSSGAATPPTRRLPSGTTLGDSASSVDQADRRGRGGRRMLIWATTATAAIAAIVFLVSQPRQKRTETEPPLEGKESPAAVAPARVAPPTVKPSPPAPAAEAPPAPATVTPAEPATGPAQGELVRIRTTPPGARVLEAATGRVLGQTPVTLRISPRQPRRLVFSKPGYRSRTELVQPGRNTELKLAPLPRAATRRPPAVTEPDPDDRRKL